MQTIKNRIKSDCGSGITVMGIFGVIFVLLVGIFIVDVSKTMYIKNTYMGYAQKAVHRGIKNQDGVGGLNFDTAKVVVDEYRRLRVGGDQGTQEGVAFHTRRCDPNGEYPIITVSFSTGRQVGTSNLQRITVNAKQSVASNPALEAAFATGAYKVVQIEVTEIQENTFAGLTGRLCQPMEIKASSIGATQFDGE